MDGGKIDSHRSGIGKPELDTHFDWFVRLQNLSGVYHFEIYIFKINWRQIKH